MKFIIHTDSNNYVIGLELSTKDEAVEVSEGILTSQYQTCYKYENSKFTFDEEKKAKLDQDVKDQIEIADLEQKLKDTDYIWNVIKEGDHDEEYYAEVIANRHTWRMRIRELEGK